MDISGEMLFNSKYIEMEETKHDVYHLESVLRIAKIPVIETSWTFAAAVYTKLKVSNPVVNWGLTSAETTVQAALEHSKPFVSKFQAPLNLVDSLLCRSLDIVEKRVPVVTLPPEMIFVSTKEYVSTNIVKPVLKRADSVKQFGREQAHNVLESKYTNFAAYRLDSALDLADKYIDHYLPDESGVTEEQTENSNSGASKAVQTLQNAGRVSRKLQRRLTQRTFAEAKALKKQSEDTLQSLLYLGELLVKDPKAVYELGLTLWAQLSKDEPENQVPPATLEQLIVMLSRESARRVVHLINYTQSTVSTLPQDINITLHRAADYCSQFTDAVIKASHLNEAKHLILTQARIHVSKIQPLLIAINNYASRLLESLATPVSRKLNDDKPQTSFASNGDVQQNIGKPQHRDGKFSKIG